MCSWGVESGPLSSTAAYMAFSLTPDDDREPFLVWNSLSFAAKTAKYL